LTKIKQTLIARFMDLMARLEALDEAIEKAGSQRALAALLYISPPSITGWRLRGQCPADRVLDIEKVTGVSRHRLREDIYPPKQENLST
jgi:DNA-binding transcriptional regulator YdaS (Cro superfamily)